MRIAEIGRSYLKSEYDGNWRQYIEAEGKYCIWDNERICHAFNFGRGSEKDFKRYVENNRCFCAFYDLEAHRFI